jgi:hypothetical protein
MARASQGGKGSLTPYHVVDEDFDRDASVQNSKIRKGFFTKTLNWK